jgi:hypothetical protein
MLISTALLLDSIIRNSVCTPAKLPCRRVEVGYEKKFISYIPSARQIREYSDCIRNIIARRKFHMKLSSYLKTES